MVGEELLGPPMRRDAMVGANSVESKILPRFHLDGGRFVVVGPTPLV